MGVRDGSEWLPGFLDPERPDALRLLDVPPAVEQLAASAQAS